MFYVRVIAIFISYASHASILGKVKKKTLELKLPEKHQNQTIYSLYLILWDKITSLPLKQTLYRFYPVNPVLQRISRVQDFPGTSKGLKLITVLLLLSLSIKMYFFCSVRSVLRFLGDYVIRNRVVLHEAHVNQTGLTFF